MHIESLELCNFRNYDILKIEFDPLVNILFGDNAQGKTNILEAMYVCGTTKSHRAKYDKEMINFNQDEAHIKLFLNKNDIKYRIDMHLKKNKTKGIAINGIPIKKSAELFGIVNIVFFSPEDLSIIKNGPSERRRFVDLELCQLDKIYVSNLINYNKCLIQRNSLLKTTNFNNYKEFCDIIDIWDQKLADYGALVVNRRLEFIKDLNNLVYVIHKNITDGKEELEISYEFYNTMLKKESSIDIDSLKSTIYKELKMAREKDIKYKSTSVGPHRDDILFYINDQEVRKYGSQGQQRTTALSLKLAEIKLVKNSINTNPILLLDDVLSELDNKRQNHLLESLEGIQTIITCTGLDEFIKSRFNADTIYKVVNGKVERSSNGK